MKIKAPKKIVISRTDSIGDVALTLPLAGILKEKYPNAQIIFLGNTYTKPIITCCTSVDQVWSWADLSAMEDSAQLNWLKSQQIDVFIHVFPRRELARLVSRAKIPHRIGTSHRLFHLLTCNHRVNFTRKNSNLHEGQLNTKLLKPLGITRSFSFAELTEFANFKSIQPLKKELKQLINVNKKQIILHPKSKGSALEWGVSRFIGLAKALPAKQYQIFFTGTEEESVYFRHQLPQQDNIMDLTGKMDLDQLIAFIASANYLVAASTGPLHIAGLCGINTVGLFTTRKPLHAGRWQPLGNKVSIISEQKASDRQETLKISIAEVLPLLTEGV